MNTGCFASDISNNSDTLKSSNNLGWTMSKDSGVSPNLPHVATKNNSSATVPLRGVQNFDSPTARLEVTDTGREVWAYDLPCIPLVIPQFSDFGRILSLFELIKRHHVDTFDSDTTYSSGQKKVENFDATDILAHKGFQFKAHAANAGDLHFSTLPRPNEIGSSTTYQSNAIVGSTQGSRILKDVSAPTATASYLTWGSTAYPGIPIAPSESFFVEITRASELYIIPTAANCKLYWMPV